MPSTPGTWGPPTSGSATPGGARRGSVLDVIHEPRLNHRVEVTPGVFAGECGELLRKFFARKRRKPDGSNGGGPENGPAE